MSDYKHTQVGTLALVVLAIPMLVMLVVALATPVRSIPIAVFLFLAVCLIMFGSLTVEVTDNAVRLRFGPGPIRKTFPVSGIREVSTVRNPWYYGWGIRWFPRGWLFNVSGLNAVELRMNDKRVYRIGTDQPEQLAAAVEHAMAGAHR